MAGARRQIRAGRAGTLAPMSQTKRRRLVRGLTRPPLSRSGVRLWIRSRGDPVRMEKRTEELDFWRGVFKRADGQPANDYFERLFYEPFGLTAEFYEDKRLLDVGCGPGGSLAWATMAAERVGVDPLVAEYRSLGLDEQEMRYVDASAEKMPFPDEYFDIVSSLNSLDHVEDVERTIAEMIRVLKPDGSLLVLVEVNHPPTVTEPISLPWELPSWFGPSMHTVSERRYESSGPRWFYEMVYADRRWDESRTEARPGLLAARLDKLGDRH